MQLTILLSELEKSALEKVVSSHEKPYMRERASAILKIASGQSGIEVAFNGLLKKRRKNTVYEWVKSYQALGIDGLAQKAGRGRKPSFSPPTDRKSRNRT